MSPLVRMWPPASRSTSPLKRSERGVWPTATKTAATAMVESPAWRVSRMRTPVTCWLALYGQHFGGCQDRDVGMCPQASNGDG